MQLPSEASDYSQLEGLAVDQVESGWQIFAMIRLLPHLLQLKTRLQCIGKPFMCGNSQKRGRARNMGGEISGE